VRVRTVVVLALACVFAVPAASAGWIQVPPRRPCPALPDGYVCSTTTQVRFGYPATWGALTSSDGGLIMRSLIWLSTEPLHEPCAGTTEGDRTTVVCGVPVSSLRPNGVLLRWGLGGLPGSNLDNLPGSPAIIGGCGRGFRLLRAARASTAADSSVGRKRSMRGPSVHGAAASTLCSRVCAGLISQRRRSRSRTSSLPLDFHSAEQCT